MSSAEGIGETVPGRFLYRQGRREGMAWLVIAHLSTDASVGHLPADPEFTAADGDYGVPTACGKRGHLTLHPPRTGRICRTCKAEQSGSKEPGHADAG